MKKKQKKEALDILKLTASVLAGNALFAFAVAGFIMPHDILMGGITGVGIFLNKSFGIDTALLILLVNVALMIIGRILLGKKFFYSTVASSLLYPLFLSLIQRIPNIGSLTDNHLLASIFAGSLLGIAIGILMRVGSSSGGTDIISLIINKYTHLPVSIIVYALDFIIIGGQAVFSGSEQLLLGIVTIVLEGLLLDKVMVLGKAQLEVFIISKEYEKIRDAVLNELSIGATMSVIETGFTGEKQMAVMCVIHPRRLYALTELVQKIDSKSFMTITKIKEVKGKGFSYD